MSDEQKNVENNMGNIPELKPKGLNKKLLLGIACILALAVIVLLLIFIPRTAAAKKVSKQLSLGEKYLSELDYEQAIAAYELAIKIDPKNEDAYIGLAEVYIAMGDLDKAEEVLKDGKKQAAETKKIREKLKEIEKIQDVNGAGLTPTPIDPEGGQTPEPTAAPTLEPTATPIPKPAATPTPEPTTEPDPVDKNMAVIGNAKVGDTVKFGSYEQDADVENGAEAIEWYVLDKQGDNVLLLSKYIIDAKAYNEEQEATTWETCTLRGWLNDDFYNTAFTDMEKGHIWQVALDTPEFGTEGRIVTKDRVFLLSLDELKRYFTFEWNNDSGRWDSGGGLMLPLHGTRQAYENYLYLYDMENATYHYKSDGYSYSPTATGWWWLRSPGETGDSVFVGSSGMYLYGYADSTAVSYNNGGVCPALWLKLNPTAAPEPTPTPAVADGEGELVDLRNASVGNRVLFGSYEQDADTSNGAEPIEWYVLDKQGDAVLLLSRYILDAIPYNKEYTNVTWENCTLRSWLNGDFYNVSFTGTEKDYIRQVTLDNPDNPYYGTKGGNATKDRVFLLSLDELRMYFSFVEYEGDWWEYGEDTRLLACGTRHAYENYLYLYDIKAETQHHKYGGYGYSPTATGWWWLRSPGGAGSEAACGDYDGVAELFGGPVGDDFGGVRPALWLNLNP